MKMPKLVGKIAIITGASSGIGAATALAFAEEGAKVVITGRNKERLQKIAKECEKFEGCQVLQIISDLCIFNNLKPVIDKTVERFGGIDVLVNNAGMAISETVENLQLEDYQKVLDLNLRAPMFLCKFALPYLKASRGCVVNVSSCGSSLAMPSMTTYCASKTALDHFTRGFAAECAEFGVRVNAVNPGIVSTNIYASVGLPLQSVLQGQPLGAIEAREIAEAILYITSSEHMTGSCVLLDGGRCLSVKTH